MKIPTKEECLVLLNKNRTHSKIIEHSKKVCKVAEDVAERLVKKGVMLNKKLIVAAALLHDMERAEENHTAKGAKLLKKLGFQEVSEVVIKHSLYKLFEKNRQPKTIEEKIVFYADKRVKGSKIVSLGERFQALEKDYSVDLSKELAFTKKIERELLGNERVRY